MYLFTIFLSWITLQNGHCQETKKESSPSNAAETSIRYVPSNMTLPRRGYGLIQFEEDNTATNPIHFDNDDFDVSNDAIDTRQLKFDDNNIDYNKQQEEVNSNHVSFEEIKKKKKRRRKPKKNPGFNKPGFQNNNEPTNINPAFGIPSYQNGNNMQDQYNLYQQFGPNQNFGIPKPSQFTNGPYYNPDLAGPNKPYPGLGLQPSNPNYGFGPGFQYNVDANYNNQPMGLPFYRPHRRPRPSLASQALSTVTGALTSIAAYDDYQCVPRLLCEAAGGGSFGNSQIIQSASKLQPLLTILSAYNGISTNPLFVFGRAVFLGASSKENPGSCRYAYPQCPTDTEQLVHYLNNYNGGFFRFFNAPQQGQQNVEQFYDQLSQNYGLYQQNQIPNHYGTANNQNQYGLDYSQNQYGLANPQNQYGLDYSQNQYGLANPQNQYGLDYSQNQYGLANPQNKYGLTNPHNKYGLVNPQNQNGLADSQYGFHRPDFNSANQNYGVAYPYYNNEPIQYKNANISKDIKVQRRILNKPDDDIFDDFEDKEPKWAFPDTNQDSSIYNNDGNNIGNIYNDDYDTRKGKALKFPEEDNLNNNHKNIHAHFGEFVFPERQRPSLYKYPSDNSDNRFVFSTGHTGIKNEYLREITTNYFDDGSRTVYVVRGNGDPNKPEIIKLKPGQSVQ